MNLGPLSMIKVVGHSMAPQLFNGDYAVVWRKKAESLTNYQVGDTVLCAVPHLPQMVKQIVDIDPNRGVLVKGSNAFSIASEAIGWVSLANIHGKVLFPIRWNSKE